MASGSGESTNFGAVFGWIGAIAGGLFGFSENGGEGAMIGAVVAPALVTWPLRSYALLGLC